MVEAFRYPPLDPEPATELLIRFTYHAPRPDQVERYAVIRTKAYELAMLLSECVPVSRELDQALVHLETAVMFANAAIARRESNQRAYELAQLPE